MITSRISRKVDLVRQPNVRSNQRVYCLLENQAQIPALRTPSGFSLRDLGPFQGVDPTESISGLRPLKKQPPSRGGEGLTVRKSEITALTRRSLTAHTIIRIHFRVSS